MLISRQTENRLYSTKNLFNQLQTINFEPIVKTLPELKKATDIEREEWEFIGQGEGISWRKFDVDISVDSLFYPTR